MQYNEFVLDSVREINEAILEKNIPYVWSYSFFVTDDEEYSSIRQNLAAIKNIIESRRYGVIVTPNIIDGVICTAEIIISEQTQVSHWIDLQESGSTAMLIQKKKKRCCCF